MAQRSAIINVMTAAATKAGKSMLRDFGELNKLQVSRKGTADFATNADRRSEKILHQELSRARPSVSFLMEESGLLEGSDPAQRFVIDPIDGTNNFIHAIPYFCVSVAYEKRLNNGQFETQAGVIYDPINNEVFSAELYQGAFLNDQRMVASGRSEMDTCMLASFVPHNEANPGYAGRVNAVLATRPMTLRVTGAMALDLAYVAAGRYDAACYVSYKPWDVAAGLLLVREAGGRIAVREETDKKLIFASNAHIHSKLAAELQAA